MQTTQTVKEQTQTLKNLESAKVKGGQPASAPAPVGAPSTVDASALPVGGVERQEHKPSENPSGLRSASLSPETSELNLKKSIADAVAGAPAPSEEAIQAHQQRESQNTETPDKGGTRAGTTRGKYKKRGAGESTLNTGRPAPAIDSASADREKFRKVGREIADTLIIAGRTLGGEDWEVKLVKDEKTGEILFDERRNLQLAWEDMAEAYEWKQFPPWLGCTLATSAYILPRLNAPSTVSRMGKLKLWWEARKIRKADEAQAKANATVNRELK